MAMHAGLRHGEETNSSAFHEIRPGPPVCDSLQRSAGLLYPARRRRMRKPGEAARGSDEPRSRAPKYMLKNQCSSS